MAFCENCGTELKAEMKFCAACGTPVASPAAPVAEPVQEPAAPVEAAPVAVAEAPAAPVAAPVAVAEVPAAPVAVAEAPVVEQPAVEAPKPKKKKGKLIALITAGVAVVAAAAVAFVMFVLPMLNKVEAAPYALYIKDGNLVFADLSVEDIEPMDLVEDVVDESNGSIQWDSLTNTMAQRVRVVGDNVFYTERNEDSKVSLLLYYRPIDDPEAEAFEIDNNVKNFVVTEDGDTVLYLTIDEEPANASDQTVGTLYRYEVGDDEAEEIVDDVMGFYASADGENIFYGDNDRRYHVMYGDEDIDLPKDAEIVAYSEDFSILLYNDDDKLMRMEDGEEEELCDRVDNAFGVNEDFTSFFYYVDGETTTYKLSEFLVNDMQNMERPTEPVEPVAPEYPSSSDYLDADGWVDWDRYQAAQDAYNLAYDEYREKRDEYYRARDEYYSKLNAFEEREELLSDAAEQTYEVRSRELYFFDGEEATKIAAGSEISRESTLDAQSVLIYTVTASGEKPQVKLSEVDSVWDLQEAVSNAFAGKKQTYVAVGKTAVKLSDTVASTASITEEGMIYYTVVDKKDETDGGAATQTLYKVKLDGEKLGKAETVDTKVEGSFSTVGEDVIYYKALASNNNDYYSYGEVYVNGTKIGAGARQWAWEYDAEGGIALFTDWDTTYSFGTLHLYKDGHVKKVAESVSDCQWSLAGDLLYLERLIDGKADLNIYNTERSDSTHIDGGVQALVPQYGGNTGR